MSKPRYPWWWFIKYIIRQYAESKSTDGLTLLQKQRWKAVHDALDDLAAYEDSAGRMTVIRLVLINQTHTISGAARMVPCSDRTATQWHGDFIRCVARHYDLL